MIPANTNQQADAALPVELPVEAPVGVPVDDESIANRLHGELRLSLLSVTGHKGHKDARFKKSSLLPYSSWHSAMYIYIAAVGQHFFLSVTYPNIIY